MKKGVQMFTVRDFTRDRESLQASLHKIKKMGYDSIQGWAPHGMSVRAYKDVCDAEGLVNCSSGGDYEQMLTDPQAIVTAIENADILGVDLIGIGTLPKELRDSADGYRRYAEGINKIAGELKKAGKRLIYHSHALEFISLGDGLKGMDILFDETDADGLHFTLDTHWLTAGGVSVTDWIHKVSGRMQVIHFKDYAIVSGAEKIEDVCKRFAEVGEGNIDWPRVIEACRATGVEYAIVEQDICPGDPFDSLAVSLRNMTAFGL